MNPNIYSIFLLLSIIQLILTHPQNVISTNQDDRIKIIEYHHAHHNINTNAEEDAIKYLEELNINYSKQCSNEISSRWNFITSINYTSGNSYESELNDFMEFKSKIQKDIQDNWEWEEFSPQTKRQFEFYSIDGPRNASATAITKINKFKVDLMTHAAAIKICEYNSSEENNCNLRLRDVDQKLKESLDFNEQLYYWSEWHDKASTSTQPKPEDFIEKLRYENIIARLNDFSNICEFKSKAYDTTSSISSAAKFDLPFDTSILWEEIKPLYNQLFAFLRMKLRENPLYTNKIKRYGYIPAHLLKSLESHDWTLLHSILSVCADCPKENDISLALEKKFPTSMEMTSHIDNYVQGMGFPSIQSFLDKSELDQRNIGKICDATAENFCEISPAVDFRINGCAKPSWKDLKTLHEKAFEISYFESYNDLHYVFRTGANPSFQEAIGKALSISLSSPNNLKCALDLDLEFPGVNCSPTTAPPTLSTPSHGTTERPTVSTTEDFLTSTTEEVTLSTTHTDHTEVTDSTTENFSRSTADATTTDISESSSTEQTTERSSTYEYTTDINSTPEHTTDTQSTTEDTTSTDSSSEGSSSTDSSTDGSSSTESSTEGSRTTDPSTESSTNADSSTEGSSSTDSSAVTESTSSTDPSTESSSSTDPSTESSSSTDPSTEGSSSTDSSTESNGSTYADSSTESGSTESSTESSDWDELNDQPEISNVVEGIRNPVDITAKNFKSSIERTNLAKTDVLSLEEINLILLHAIREIPSMSFFHAYDEWINKTCMTEIENYNWKDLSKDFWNKRSFYQGIASNVVRTNKFDLFMYPDLLISLPLFRSFLGRILEFQIFQGICIKLGKYDPSMTSSILCQCDLSGNSNVGPIVLDALKDGFSNNWENVLEKLTGDRTIKTDGIINYFAPLKTFLDEQLKGEQICFANHCTSEAENYMESTYEPNMKNNLTSTANALWNYAVNLSNSDYETASIEYRIQLAHLQRKFWTETISQYEFDEEALNESKYLEKSKSIHDDKNIRRQIKLLSVLGTPVLTDSELYEYYMYIINMSKLHQNVTICPYEHQNSCSLESEEITLESGIQKVFAESTDYQELAFAWKALRDSTGKPIKELFMNFSTFSNEITQRNEFEDIETYWLRHYESSNFKIQVSQAWIKIKKFYLQLHAFVRYKLSQTYNEVKSNGLPIPAHLLGTPWSDNWENIYQLVKPYENELDLNINEVLAKKFEYTETGIRKMFEFVDSFFVGLGLKDMTSSFDADSNSLIIKPNSGQIIDCTKPSTWDFSNGKDYRVKMCTNITMADFLNIHHQLSNIQYYMQYNNQPLSFQHGGNPAFTDAIGGAIKLVASTPHHLKNVGLSNLTIPENNKEFRINFLLKIALSQIPKLPYLYGLDTYRLGLLDGTISKDNMTYDWLRLNSEFQGITPPFKRSETDFDAGALLEIIAEESNLHEFIAIIQQFQILEKVCETSGTSNLYDCDITNNTDAGNYLRTLMSQGLSKPWWKLIDQSNPFINTDPLLNYFNELIEYFNEQELQHTYTTGWDSNAWKEYYDDGSSSDGSNSNEKSSSKVGIIIGSVVAIVVVVGGIVGFIIWKKLKTDDLSII